MTPRPMPGAELGHEAEATGFTPCQQGKSFVRRTPLYIWTFLIVASLVVSASLFLRVPSSPQEQGARGEDVETARGRASDGGNRSESEGQPRGEFASSAASARAAGTAIESPAGPTEGTDDERNAMELRRIHDLQQIDHLNAYILANAQDGAFDDVFADGLNQAVSSVGSTAPRVQDVVCISTMCRARMTFSSDAELSRFLDFVVRDRLHPIFRAGGAAIRMWDVDDDTLHYSFYLAREGQRLPLLPSAEH